jgi:predicted esterase
MTTTQARGVQSLARGLLIGWICASCTSRVTDGDPRPSGGGAGGAARAEAGLPPPRDATRGSPATRAEPEVEVELADAGGREQDSGADGVPAPSGAKDPSPDRTAAAPEHAAPAPDERLLAPASGPCPAFRAGRATFMPDGRARSVEIAMSDRANEADGALVFTWFATAGTPAQALGWLGQAVVTEIEDEGGVIVAPYADQASSTRPWYNTQGGPGEGDQDLRLMDEVIACARDSIGVDLSRIHAIGMSAGGLQTTQVAFRRSGYIASVAIYSGGLLEGEVPPDQDPDNKFSAMVLFGGTSDISPVDGIAYLDASNRLVQRLGEQGRFVLLCDHGGGHSVPVAAQRSVWRFFTDHPYGTQPSPYASGIPNGFVAYCAPQ